MTILLLWFLATVDSTFIGYRETAGRNALIQKRAYYRRAMIRGAVAGQVAVAIVGVVAVVMLALTPQPAALFHDLERVATRMLLIYVPYALILAATFFVRAIPSVDIRSITSVLVFGPFTLIRPLVVLSGAIWGLLAAPRIEVLVLIVLIVCLMLGMSYVLGQLRARKIFHGT
jgi:L-asparagine transporter-like permease